MNPGSLILRFLLALVLAANGVGSAFAVTRMQVERIGPVAIIVDEGRQAGAAAAQACVEHAGMDETVSIRTAGPAGAAASDWCEAGPCVYACVLHAVSPPVNVRVLESLLERDTTAKVRDIGHAAPALPHLIRPPIG